MPKTKKPKPFIEAIGRFINGVQDANDDDDDDDIYLKPSTQTQRKKIGHKSVTKKPFGCMLSIEFIQRKKTKNKAYFFCNLILFKRKLW